MQWRLTEHAVMDRPRLVMPGPLFFTGRSDRIGPLVEQFRGLRRRRLVILGGPGSGKTTLAVQLLLELLATRRTAEPIPVLLSLASWDPTEQPRMNGWLIERLAEDYPYLVSASDRRQGARGTRTGSGARMGLGERMSSPRTAMASQPC